MLSVLGMMWHIYENGRDPICGSNDHSSQRAHTHTQNALMSGHKFAAAHKYFFFAVFHSFLFGGFFVAFSLARSSSSLFSPFVAVLCAVCAFNSYDHLYT